MTVGILDWHGTSLILPGQYYTASAQRRVSAVTDVLGLVNNFTQSTDANKPLLSRTDNKGNLLRNSHVVNSWSSNTNVGVSGTTVTANAGAANHAAINTSTGFRGNLAVAGMTLRQIIEVEYVNHQWFFIGDGGDSPWRGVRFDLQNGLVNSSINITSVTVETVSAGRYKITLVYPRTVTANTSCYVTFGTSSIATGATSYTAAGTEQVKVHYSVVQHADWDTDVLETTDHPQFAGVNGRQGLVLHGAQQLASTSITSSVFTNNAKIAYLVVKPFLLNVAQSIFRDTPNWWSLQMMSSGGRMLFTNYDTNYDEATSIVLANQLYIIRARHDSGFIYIAQDSGAGFSAETGLAVAASGNTGNMTFPLVIGTTTNGFYGYILAIATDDSGTLTAATTAYEEALRRFFFTQTETQSSNIRIADNKLLQDALTITATSSLEAGHDVYSVVSSKRSNFIQRASNGTSQTVDITLRSGNEQSCNYLIVTKARRLAAAGCTAIALQYSDDNIIWNDFLTSDFSEYVGEFEQDLFICSNESSLPYRYWRVSMTGSSNKFPLANIYAGMLFDFEREPDRIQFKADIEGAAKESTKGDLFAARMQKPLFRYDLLYRAITDTKANEARRFVDKAHYLPVFLVTTDDHTLLNNIKCLHCEVRDYKVIKRTTNYNEVDITLEELVK